MKNYLSKEFFDSTNQLFRKMRTTCLVLMVCVSSLFAANVKSQVAKVNISFKNVSILQVIETIENQTDYLFVYDKNVLDLNREVSLEVKNQSVAEVLNNIFSNTNVIYAMEGTNIMLMQKSEAEQQQRKVSGKVTDSSGVTLPGVSVIVKGTTTGVITDMDGKYSLSKVPENATLVFSFVGMKTQEIAVSGKTDINVTLLDETIGIDEVVALGYTTQKKRDMIGSVAKISDQQLAAPAYKNFTSALQGKASGVYVSGDKIRIRGVNSISLSTEPLWIIDGIPGNGSNLNPNDIESISILKDASATALYGSSGANGVIAVTTKSMKGKKSQIKVELTSGLSELMNTDLKLMDNKQMLSFMDQAKLNASKYDGSAYAPYDPNVAWNWDIKIPNRITREEAEKNNFNGFKESVQNGKYNQMYLNATKGFDSGSALFTLTYRNEEGDYKGLSSDKILSRVVFNFSPMKNVEININSINNYNKAKSTGMGSSGFGGVDIRPPFMPLYDINDPTGYWAPGDNPLITGDDKYRNNRNEAFSSLNYAKIKIDLPFIKGLSIAGIGSANFNYSKSWDWYAKELMSFSNQTISQATEATSFGRSYLYRGEVNYDRIIGKHAYAILLLAEGTKGYSSSLNASGYNLNGSYPILGTPSDKNTMNSTIAEGGGFAYIGRATYKFKDRYLFEANIRRDGLSVLPRDNRWAIFPSMGLGWIISDEPFFSKGIFNMLKLRGSIGKTGNAAVPSFAYIPTLGIKNPSSSSYDQYNYTLITNIAANVKWETSDNLDFGFDYGLLENKINGSVAYFNKETSGLLLKVPLPPSAGLSSAGNSYWANVGNMRNSGFEFSLNMNPIRTKYFTWDVSINHTIVDNKVLSLDPNIDIAGTGIFGSQNRTITKKGEKLATYYLPIYNGVNVDKGNTEIYERDAKIFAETGTTIATGKLINGTTVNAGKNQFVMTGKSQLPTFYGGIRNTITYKEFDCILMITYSGGNYFLDEYDRLTREVGIGQMALRESLINEVWKKPGDVASEPDAIYNGGTFYNDAGELTNKRVSTSGLSTKYLKPADNIQIKEITLGYTFRKSLISMISLDNLRLYFNINNPIYWSKAGNERNPEVQISSGNVDGYFRNGTYLNRTYSLGLLVNF